MVGAALLLTLNLAVLAQEDVPGRPGFALATFIVAALAFTVLLRAAADWSPGERWRGLFASAVAHTRSDPGGTGILLGGVAVFAVTTWALWVLAVPMAGCLVGAAVAVRRRRLDRMREDAGK
jgi:cobalamin synthase